MEPAPLLEPLDDPPLPLPPKVSDVPSLVEDDPEGLAVVDVVALTRVGV